MATSKCQNKSGYSDLITSSSFVHEDGSRLLVWQLLTLELRLKLRGCLRTTGSEGDDVKYSCSTCKRVTRCAVTAVKHVTRYFLHEENYHDRAAFECPTCTRKLFCDQAAKHLINCVKLRCVKCDRPVSLSLDLHLNDDVHRGCILSLDESRDWVKILAREPTLTPAPFQDLDDTEKKKNEYFTNLMLTKDESNRSTEDVLQYLLKTSADLIEFSTRNEILERVRDDMDRMMAMLNISASSMSSEDAAHADDEVAQNEAGAAAP